MILCSWWYFGLGVAQPVQRLSYGLKDRGILLRFPAEAQYSKSLLTDPYQNSLREGKAAGVWKRPEEIKNAWSYTPTSPYTYRGASWIFMVYQTKLSVAQIIGLLRQMVGSLLQGCANTGRPIFVVWRLNSMCLQYETCSMSPWWHLEFRGGSVFFPFFFFFGGGGGICAPLSYWIMYWTGFGRKRSFVKALRKNHRKSNPGWLVSRNRACISNIS